MTPAKHLELVKERLLADPIVTGFHIRRERCTVTDAHLRVRVTLIDDSRLEFSEYVERTAEDEDSVQVIVYSYHWENAEGALIRHWDNLARFPNVPEILKLRIIGRILEC
jgi:hypothetical protein